jgi:hypothetical protein
MKFGDEIPSNFGKHYRKKRNKIERKGDDILNLKRESDYMKICDKWQASRNSLNSKKGVPGFYRGSTIRRSTEISQNAYLAYQLLKFFIA